MPAPPARAAAPTAHSAPPWRALAGLVAGALVAGLLLFLPAGRAQAAASLLSQGRPVTASSEENHGTAAANAVDGNTGTRWSSANTDPQWIQVDLGAVATVSQVVLTWEAAYGKAYRIQLSADGTSWTDAYSTTTGAGGTETLNVSGT
ncbi:discoidin domain-containing protein, partial [Kitasatospora sp. NPDC007106]|uniref:discoidin domain-containing protein n=1 Tax=Kitasatospora sp. NPDC007106 TaxID=3156914 RepID=UPI003403C961